MDDTSVRAGDPFDYAGRKLLDQEREERPHGCYAGITYIGHMVVGEDGEEVEVIDVIPCRRCEEGSGAKE